MKRRGADRRASVLPGSAAAAPETVSDAAASVSAELARVLRDRALRERPRRVLRFLRLVYLDELDRSFPDHLAQLTSLRDDIALSVQARGRPVGELQSRRRSGRSAR